MGTVAVLTVSNVGMLLIFVAVGCLLRVTKKLPENAGKMLSMLSATIFCPAYNMHNMWKNFTVERIGENGLIVLYGVLFTFITIGVGLVLARFLGKPGLERRSLSYAFAIPNYGYFGYPVVQGVFGELVKSQFMIFCVPLSIATNSYGYLLFTPGGKLTWKRFFNPMLISVLLGMILGITGVPMVAFADKTLSLAGNCMSPVAMLLAGFLLGGFPLKKLFTNFRSYWLSAIRLVGIPVVFGGVLYLLGARGLWLLLPVAVFALPLGLNLVVYPESQGMDASDNARFCCISYILSIAVLPVVFGVLQMIV